MWLTHAFTVRTKALLLQCSLLPSSIFTIIKLASKMYWSKRTFETCQLLCWLKQFSFDYEKVTERMQLWRGKALALDQSDCGRMYSPSNQMPETQCGHGNAKVTVLPGQSHFARKKISQSNFYQSFKKHHSLAKACIWHQAFHSQTKTALISFSTCRALFVFLVVLMVLSECLMSRRANVWGKYNLQFKSSSKLMQ